ncbi:MAG: radical SAM protein [Nanoarchaeota archaeon]|nr:radical SAM protein [Nanoarchaeota archaeon]
MGNQYAYSDNLLDAFPDLEGRLASGRVVPYQVELHPAPSGRELCWLKCSHCYMQGDIDDAERVSGERLVDVIDDLSKGSPRTGERPKQLVISGFRTDPLNSASFVKIFRAAKERGFATGLHTKGLVLGEEAIRALAEESIQGDYMTFSVDAGDNSTYASVHDANGQSRLYNHVVENVRKLVESVRKRHSPLRIQATYLLTEENCGASVESFVKTFLDMGMDSLRFSVPILPTMAHQSRDSDFPSISDQALSGFKERFKGLSRRFGERLVYLRFEKRTRRTLPCYSRWLYPTVGFDGNLYPCCLTASKEFSAVRIADLKKEDFWGAYYRALPLDFTAADCQCDRKSEEVNLVLRQRMMSGSRAASSRVCKMMTESNYSSESSL